jgi:hypothetical protein
MVFEMLKPYGMILRSESRLCLSVTENSLWNSGLGCRESVGALGASLAQPAYPFVFQAGITRRAYHILRVKKPDLPMAALGTDQAKTNHRLWIQRF